MATGTARDLITAALKRLGVISGIETPAADLAEDSLARLNDLIETWSTESLTLWTESGTQFPNLPVNPQPTYSVGPGGDCDIPIRPAWLESVSWFLAGTPAMEFKLSPMSRQEFENEQFKQLTSTQPTHYFYSTDWPLGFIHLWPRNSVAATLGLYYPIVFQGPAALATVFVLPPGYWRALRDALALELAPEVGRPVDPALVQSAIDAKSQLQRVNFRPRLLGMPPEIATGNYSGYDWRTD